jgi:hypothetical protein
MSAGHTTAARVYAHYLHRTRYRHHRKLGMPALVAWRMAQV